MMNVMRSPKAKNSNIRKCLVPGHGKSRIISLCLDKSCKGDRLVCAMCLNDNHSGHSTAPLDPNIKKSKINNLRKNSTYINKEINCEQIKKALEAKFKLLIQKPKLFFKTILQFKTKCFQDLLEPMCNTIIQSFNQNTAEDCVKILLDAETTSDQIQKIALSILQLQKPHLSNPQILLKATDCMIIKIQQVFQKAQQILPQFIEHIQIGISQWSLFEKSDWASQFKDLDQTNLMDDKMSQNSNKKADIKNIKQMQEKLILFAQKNNWKSIIQWVESGQKLINLKTLDLTDSQITKIKALDSLTSLTKLNLSWNHIQNIQNLQTLKNLEYLNLNQNQITRIQNLSSLTNLKIIDLSVNQIRKIQNLEALVNLQSLFLNYNQIQKIINIQCLKKLTVFSIRNNLIEKLPNLGFLKNLNQLYLQYNSLKSIETLIEIKSLRKVQLQPNQILSNSQNKVIIDELKKKNVAVILNGSLSSSKTS